MIDFKIFFIFYLYKMYQYLSISLFALGLILLFSPNTIISKESSYYQTISDNNTLLGFVSLFTAYYLYTLISTDSATSTPLLPSYEEATTSVSSQ